MTLEESTQLYASVLRQLLPTGGYDTSPNTEALAVDVYAHAKLLAQADLDAKRLLMVLEGFPTELLPEYETEYGLPLKCSINAGKSLEERIELLKWVRSTRNVLNRAYFDQILKIFGVELFEFKKFRPMQCNAPCNAPVNTEQLRYKVRIVIPDTAPADMDCIIQNYFPGYLRIDVLKVPFLFKTSKPYPLYFVENFFSSASFSDAIQKVVMNSTDSDVESVLVSASLAEATWRDVMNNTDAEIESVVTSALITEVMRCSIMNSTSTITEAVTASALITAASRRVALLTNTAEPESCTVSAMLISAQITN